MHFKESETLELKSVATDDLKKEIIAFANSGGGKIYVGVEDDGGIIGINHSDETMLQISNMVRDAIKPDITMFIHYRCMEVEGKEIIELDIQRGTNRPYYIAKKGLRSEGVYVRQGTSSVPATESAIRQMIKETDGDRFEGMRSLQQELTFNAAEKIFDSRKIVFENIQKKTLGLENNEGIYTNLGLLLSDQCPYTVKAASFSGTEQGDFRDRREYGGSLLKQMEEIYAYIDLHNNTRSTFEQLQRIDSRDYPEVAVREALLNALVHRDYSFGASTIISIYENRIEFVSIGGLLPGISLEDVMLGLSVCRNPQLANVFYRLELIEAYGTGIGKIMSSYADKPCKPEIITTANGFKIILPNTNYTVKHPTNRVEESRRMGYPLQSAVRGIYHSEKEQIILLAEKNIYITRKEVEDCFRISQTSAGRILKEMVQENILLQEGRGKNTRYRLRK